MTFNYIIEKIYSRRHLRITLHILFWILLFVIKFYITIISFNVYRSLQFERVVMINLSSTFFIALFYYILVYWLIPVIRRSKKYLQFFLSVLLLYILYVSLDSYFELTIIQSCKECLLSLQKDNLSYYNFLNTNISNIILQKLSSLGPAILLLFVLCIPFCIKLMLQLFRNELKAVQLAKDNLQLEFNFLKAQINPHFLFNTMNNIYGLILQGDNKRSAGLVARLSELLRYILYESDNKTMSIDKEIKLANDYIELEKARLNDTTVSFNVNDDKSINELAPLLLMPLIENAFKYISCRPGSFIKISLEIINSKLLFKIENSIDENRLFNNSGGIGLTNFKKRLELYYAGKYNYETCISASTYNVNLNIQML